MYFKKTGSGSLVLLVFHGFGQDHAIFNDYLPLLSDKYTVYSFDIFYHGKSTRSDTPLTHEEWTAHFKRFLKAEKISRFSMLAFSLGGRFCISINKNFSQQIESFIMLAPDGIYTSFWYKMAGTYIGTVIFKYYMSNEKRFNSLINLFSKLSIASPSLIKFAQKELGSQDRRVQVYKTWTFFRKLQMTRKDLKSCFSKNRKPIQIILGNLDTIVTVQDVRKRLKHFNNVEILTVRAKHGQMIDESQRLVASLLLVE